MLGSKTQYSLKNAESYFREHLKVGDYYMEGRTVSGEWIGDGAKKLNLWGVTTEKDFINLCRNVNPQTGEQLTPRMNGKRISVDKNGVAHEYANRRVFFDFTISPPKSVSIAALVGNDKRIIEAHEKAVRLAMSQFEVFAATRVRLDGQYDYRRTFNLVGAVFRHDTSRALDPHLHSHCILLNATYDAKENRWKALETCEMFPAQKFIENVYYHELVKSLQRFGYRIQNNPRGDFEIEGVSKELIDRFSKRHREIDEKTKELLEREPDKASQNIKVTRQHGAVEASDALRAIEKYSGLGFAVLTNIRRQNPETAKDAAERQWLTQYRLAVNEARQGKLGASFDRLDKHDAIVSCTLADQQQKLTEHFLKHFKNQQSTVIVSQSWSEIRKVNERVTNKLAAHSDSSKVFTRWCVTD